MYAQNPQMEVRPKFEAERAEHGYRRTVYKKGEDGFDSQVEVCKDGGWIVYFPQGHSIRVTDEKEMIRLGFMAAPALVDMNSGEQLTPDRPQSLKELVKHKTRGTARQRATGIPDDVAEVEDALGIQ